MCWPPAAALGPSWALRALTGTATGGNLWVVLGWVKWRRASGVSSRFLRSRRLETGQQVHLANLERHRAECLAAAAETIRTLPRLSGSSQEKDTP